MPRRLPTPRLLAALSVLALLLIGIWLGGHPRFLPRPIADAFTGSKATRTVDEALNRIHDEYYRDPSDSGLSDAAISGAVASLHDRFSNYFTPKEFESFNEVTSGRFSGVGIVVQGVKSGLLVQTVYDRSPAARAGIRKGDLIIAAGKRTFAKLTEAQASALIKGPPGSVVRLKLRRGHTTLTKRVTRATVSVPVVASEFDRAPGGKLVAHIALATFSDGAHDEVEAAIRRAKARKVAGIVFDLRANGGGLVKEAQLISSDFIASGVIVTTRGRAVKTTVLRALGQPIAGSIPLVVLVDRNTASASEIVTGALQDHHRATVVGEKTFGKGVFQQVIPLSEGGALDLTVGRYFTPSGRNLGGVGTAQGAGITPDVHAVDNPKTKPDEALQAALSVLAKKL